MKLHRIIPVAPFVADPSWSETQVVPPLLANGPTSTSESLILAPTSAGVIYWTATPYDGADLDLSKPVDGTGMTFDARLVYAATVNVGPANLIVIGRKSPGEVELALIPVGREIIESRPTAGCCAVLQMIAVAGVPPGCTHLWLSWLFEPAGIR